MAEYSSRDSYHHIVLETGPEHVTAYMWIHRAVGIQILVHVYTLLQIRLHIHTYSMYEYSTCTLHSTCTWAQSSVYLMKNAYRTGILCASMGTIIQVLWVWNTKYAYGVSNCIKSVPKCSLLSGRRRRGRLLRHGGRARGCDSVLAQASDNDVLISILYIQFVLQYIVTYCTYYIRVHVCCAYIIYKYSLQLYIIRLSIVRGWLQ